MTDKERAIAVFKSKIEWEKEKRYPFISNEEVEACKLAIKALEQEPILDKIRAEIQQEREEAYIMFGHALGFDQIATYDKCIGIIDKHMEELEGEES